MHMRLFMCVHVIVHMHTTGFGEVQVSLWSAEATLVYQNHLLCGLLSRSRSRCTFECMHVSVCACDFFSCMCVCMCDGNWNTYPWCSSYFSRVWSAYCHTNALSYPELFWRIFHNITEKVTWLWLPWNKSLPYIARTICGNLVPVNTSATLISLEVLPWGNHPKSICFGRQSTRCPNQCSLLLTIFSAKDTGETTLFCTCLLLSICCTRCVCTWLCVWGSLFTLSLQTRWMVYKTLMLYVVKNLLVKQSDVRTLEVYYHHCLRSIVHKLILGKWCTCINTWF